MASMFVCNAAVVIIPTKLTKNRLWMVSYERRNKRRKLLYDGKLFQPYMVGQVVREKPEEKGNSISQESQITLVQSKIIRTFKYFIISHLYNNTLKT